MTEMIEPATVEPQPTKKRSDLLPRLMTALVAIPILLGIIFLTPPEGFLVLVMLAGAITVHEYCQITYGSEHPSATKVVSVIGAGLIAALFFFTEHAVISAGAAFVLVYELFLFRYKDQPSASRHISHSITALCYGALMFGTLALLRKAGGSSGPFWVVMALAIIWGSDTGAYFAGRTFGKRKLYKAVSPNKSVEGAVGGLVAAVLFALAFDALFGAVASVARELDLGVWRVTLQWKPLEVWQAVLVAVVANVLGQTGDLAESLLKRSHDVKDSGAIFPGHGGMMDRIDALIFSSPWFYAFVTLIQ